MPGSRNSKNLLTQAFGRTVLLSFIPLGVSLALINLSAESAQAAGIVGSGTRASCTESALDRALEGGGVVIFNCGSEPHTINLNREKVISQATQIDGGNLITLSGRRKNRVFSTIGGFEFSVKNLTIANGFTNQDGAGIASGYNGKLSVSNCKFINNVSTKTGEFGGGAIFIASESTAVIHRSTFIDNQAWSGGAISNLLSDLTVTNSTFEGNQAVGDKGSGGAIYIDGGDGDTGKITVRDSTFESNTAIFQGGSIFVQLYNSNTLTLENSIFSENSVTGSGEKGFGGAIFSVGGTLEPRPGIIYKGGPNRTLFTLKNTTFSGNTATRQGGAMWSSIATLNITNSTFSGNRVGSTDKKNGLGGAIKQGGGKININNTTIANNYAAVVGGGIFGNQDVTIKNVILANNVADNEGKINNNCYEPLTNGGNNLQFPAINPNNVNDRDCTSGILTADPKLGSLGKYGGSTPTIPLLSGSAAIGAGNNASCADTDQRGVSRPQGRRCDIGAFEVD